MFTFGPNENLVNRFRVGPYYIVIGPNPVLDWEGWWGDVRERERAGDVHKRESAGDGVS